jgi:cyclase
LTDNGREHTGLDAVEWAKRGIDLGAGELLITSVDMEGTRKGMDLELVCSLGPTVGVPVIACGGPGNIEHVAKALDSGADAVAIASLLHYKMESVGSLKAGLRQWGIEVRA